jgi:hypothetical protein
MSARQLRMLEPAQRDRLAQLEAVVARGLETFVAVGAALLEIRDSGLYRDTHGSFEMYCRERWDLSKPYASQLIVASETVAIATTTGLPAPSSESVARQLAPLRDEPEQVREAWAETVERHGEQPTAKQTRAVVNGRRPSPNAVAPMHAQTPTWVVRLDLLAEELRGVVKRGLPADVAQRYRAAFDLLDAMHVDLRRLVGAEDER